MSVTLVSQETINKRNVKFMSFEQELKSKFLNYGFNLTEKQAEQFKNYFKLLILWNKKFNLTTITTQSDVIIKHFLDSVLAVDNLEQNSCVIDLGTGAGFPGIPLKIMREDINLCLVDSLKKKTVFLKEVVESLQLENVLIIHSRSEDLAHKPGHREGYNHCVSRAVAKLNTLLEYCSPFLKTNGTVIAYKAKTAQEETKEAENAAKELKLVLEKQLNFNIAENNSERTVIIYKKTGKTPNAYPRLQNKPKTNPL